VKCVGYAFVVVYVLLSFSLAVSWYIFCCHCCYVLCMVNVSNGCIS